MWGKLTIDEFCQKVTKLQSYHFFLTQFVFCKNCQQGFHIGDCETSSEFFNSNDGRQYSVNFDRIADAKWDEASNIAIKVLTKPCPKCRTATERAGGCMHMVSEKKIRVRCQNCLSHSILFYILQDCTRCNFEWCWVCQIEWNRDCMGAHWFG